MIYGGSLSVSVILAPSIMVHPKNVLAPLIATVFDPFGPHVASASSARWDVNFHPTFARMWDARQKGFVRTLYVFFGSTSEKLLTMITAADLIQRITELLQNKQSTSELLEYK
jgi:hypothetical protein